MRHVFSYCKLSTSIAVAWFKRKDNTYPYGSELRISASSVSLSFTPGWKCWECTMYFTKLQSFLNILPFDISSADHTGFTDTFFWDHFSPAYVASTCAGNKLTGFNGSQCSMFNYLLVFNGIFCHFPVTSIKKEIISCVELYVHRFNVCRIQTHTL